MNALLKFDTPGPESVRLGDDRQVRYWCMRLNCSERQLRTAVGRVGSKPGDVRRAILSGAAG
jgi:hypothetical protein